MSHMPQGVVQLLYVWAVGPSPTKQSGVACCTAQPQKAQVDQVGLLQVMPIFIPIIFKQLAII